MNPVHTVLKSADAAMALARPEVHQVLHMQVANLIGGGAGQAVVTTVTFPEAFPTPYNVGVTCDQDATAFVTAKTSAGFTLTMRPRLAASTLAVGSNDITVSS